MDLTWKQSFLIFHFQGRAVHTARSLEEGHSKVLVPETLDVVFEENNGKLVLLAGSLSIEDPLTDPSYGVSIRAVKLKKKVQVRFNFDYRIRMSGAG